MIQNSDLYEFTRKLAAYERGDYLKFDIKPEVATIYDLFAICCQYESCIDCILADTCIIKNIDTLKSKFKNLNSITPEIQENIDTLNGKIMSVVTKTAPNVNMKGFKVTSDVWVEKEYLSPNYFASLPVGLYDAISYAYENMEYYDFVNLIPFGMQYEELFSKFENMIATHNSNNTGSCDNKPKVPTQKVPKDTSAYKKEDFIMENIMNKMFAKIANGLCRFSIDGKIAIKTNSGYKTYDIKTKKLVNVSEFAFDVGSDMFFAIPTNKIKPGDNIIVNDKPKCVISVTNEYITVLCYENNTIEQMVPETHMFMGNTYFYSKIVSILGSAFGNTKGAKNIMSYFMMSEMMKSTQGQGGNSQRSSGDSLMTMLPMMMLMGGKEFNMFDGIFSECDDCTDTDSESKNSTDEGTDNEE